MPGRALNARAVMAAVIGNALEWYDFTVFGFMTVVIARVFFPSSSDYSSILLTTATFGVAFVMRPVGGIVLGLYADRAGRKAALTLVIGLMTLGILLLAIAPPYSAIGIGAPLVIVFARLLQGFSAGGEFGSSTALLIEAAPFSKRGFYGSFQMASQAASLLLGAMVGSAISRGLSPEALDSWGWRVPFIFGLVIGPVGLYIRRNMADTEAFLHAKKTARRATLGEVFSTHGREVLCGLGSVIALTVSVYVLIAYLPTFAVKQLKLPFGQSFTALIVGNLLLTVLSPVTGAWSDRIGARALDRAFPRVQHRGDDLRRLRTVHRDVAHPRDRIATRTHVLYDGRARALADHGGVHPGDAPCGCRRSARPHALGASRLHGRARAGDSS